MSRNRWAQLGVVGSCTLSVALSLLPAGVGGPVRAVDAALFMLIGPGVAGMVTVHRARSVRTQDALQLPPMVELVLWTSASVATLALTSTGLLVAGAWSVPVMVAVVASETFVLALWPVSSGRAGSRRAKTAEELRGV